MRRTVLLFAAVTVMVVAYAGAALAQTGDDAVVAWGSNEDGQTNVPSELGSVKAISAGNYHSLALKEDGTVVAWGANYSGQTNVPSGLSGVKAISAGWDHSLAIGNLALRDRVSPTVTSVVPVEKATGIGPRANVSAFFSEAMRNASINTNTVKLMRAGTTTPLAAAVSYDAEKKKAILNPNNNLKRGAKYKAVVTVGAKDLAGNRLDQNPSVAGNQQKVWFFRVRN